MNPAVEKLMQMLPGFEGNVPHFYLDTKGLVTCGIGHFVPDVTHACEKIGFAGAPTAEEIAGDFESVRAAHAGYLPKFYRRYCALSLLDGWAEADAADRLEKEFLPAVEKLFPDFNGYPLPVRVALLDMSYNLGIAGLGDWTKLRAAVEARNWDQAVRESHRLGIQMARNEWTRNQFTPEFHPPALEASEDEPA